MTAVVRSFICIDCGAPTRRKRQFEQPLTCLDCGIKRALSASRDMFNHEGPYWEAHQRAMRERSQGTSP